MLIYLSNYFLLFLIALGFVIFPDSLTVTSVNVKNKLFTVR